MGRRAILGALTAAAFIAGCSWGGAADNEPPQQTSAAADATQHAGGSSPVASATTSSSDGVTRAEQYAAVTNLVRISARVSPAVDHADLATWAAANPSCPYVAMDDVLRAEGPASEIGAPATFAAQRLEDSSDVILLYCTIGPISGNRTQLTVALMAVEDISAFVHEFPQDQVQIGQVQPLTGGQMIGVAVSTPGSEAGCAYWTGGSIVISLCAPTVDAPAAVNWMASALPVILHGLAAADPTAIVVPSP